PTRIRGSVALSGTASREGIEVLASDLTLQNDEPGDANFVKATGRITYGDNTVELPDSFVLDLGYGTLYATGKINLDKERMTVSLATRDVDLQPLGYMIGLDSLSGKVGGTVDIVGYLMDPSVNGYLTIQNGKIGQSEASTLSVSFLVNSLMKNRHGSLRAVATGGRFLDYDIDRGTSDIYFRGDTILVESIRLEGSDDFFQLSGRIVGGDFFLVNQLQLSLSDQYVTSVGQVVLRRTPGELALRPAVFRVNDGTAEVSFSLEGGKFATGDLHLVNFDLASLRKVFHRNVPIVGAAFADFSVHTVGDRLEAEGTFEVKDGRWEGIEFDNFLVSALLEDNQVYIKELNVSGPDGMGLEVSGFYDVKDGATTNLLEIDPPGEISFSSEFHNLQLKLLAGFLPEGWKLGGVATGSLVMAGKAESPEMVFEFTIDKPWFDRIFAKQISGSGRYTDQRLYFEDLVGDSYAGRYTGDGYLPVDLSLVSNKEDRFLDSEPISMTFSAETSNMDFLTPFWSAVDSITGDIDIQVSISGTPANPVRNGEIRIRDGTIYALMLDFPLDHVNGSAVLKNNKFIIDELVAESHVPADVDWTHQLKSNLAQVSGGILFGKTGGKPSPNVRVTGSMDMGEFFHPNLAFLVSGKDVYVRTLLGEIEGVAELNLSVTGKDTVSIVGDILPREAVLRMEFAEDSEYGDMTSAGSTVSRYQLHFPIGGKLFLRNSQIDAELSGDMSIQKLGNGPYRYSGELDVIGGKFYYYSDVFDIEEGHLVFDPSEFNPKMDIRATTEISKINIEVTLSGDFNEPIVVIEDSEQKISQGDLLQLLTMQRRFDEQDLSTSGLSDQSVYLFGKFLKSEIERSLVRATPLLDEFEIEGSSSLLAGSDESDLALKVGTRFSSNLYLSYKQSFSLTQPSQVGVEYRLNRNVSLVVTYDDDGQMHLKYRRKYKF
ncbi:MAG: translocation/assembly module TamB domain-containing protein, partial [Fidelibacterota bacterium]